MTPAENIINAVRHLPIAGSLTTCFVVRAIKAYAKTLRSAPVGVIAQSIPSEDALAWQRAARVLHNRLEAAAARGVRLDDDFFRTLVNGQDRDVLRRFVLRAVRNYASHIASMPRARVAHALRGIEAWRWQNTARDVVDAIETIEAFDATPARN